MSESAAAATALENDERKLEETKNSDDAGEGDDAEEEEEEEDDDADDNFINNHDLIGVQGIIAAQKNEIEKKKVSHRHLPEWCRLPSLGLIKFDASFLMYV